MGERVWLDRNWRSRASRSWIWEAGEVMMRESWASSRFHSSSSV